MPRGKPLLRTGRRRRLVVRRPVLQHGRIRGTRPTAHASRSRLAPSRDRAPDGVAVVRRQIIFTQAHGSNKSLKPPFGGDEVLSPTSNFNAASRNNASFLRPVPFSTFTVSSTTFWEEGEFVHWVRIARHRI